MSAPLKNYTFDHTAKTVTLTDVTTVRLDRLKVIFNATLNVAMYVMGDSTVTATVATNVITLSAVPGSAANTDKLIVIYEPISTDTAFADVTQPVSGTVTTTPPANASTNVAQIAGTAPDVGSGNKSAGTQRVVLATDQPALTNALKVDGSAVTQPVSDGGGSITVDATALPLPTGAATAAKQPALGTAGSAAADVLSVQGIASGTALKTDPSAVTSPTSVADGSNVTIGAKADNRSTATDTTAASLIALIKELSYLAQQATPPIIDLIKCVEVSTVANTVVNADIDTSAFTTMNELEIINESGTDIVRYSIGTTSVAPTDPSTTVGGVLAGAGVPSSITLPNNTKVASIRVKVLSPTGSLKVHVNAKGH